MSICFLSNYYGMKPNFQRAVLGTFKSSLSYELKLYPMVIFKSFYLTKFFVLSSYTNINKKKLI